MSGVGPPPTILAADSPAKGAALLQRDPLTRVRLLWIEGKVEHWIRFGRVVHERILDRRTRVLGFRADAVFAFLRWVSNDYGTITSRIDIVRAVREDAAYSTLPGVEPGGEILLHVSGWPRVERVLQAIDQIEDTGVDPCDAAPEHWRHIHNRMAASLSPRSYSLDRHQAWLRRKELLT
jgi:hypothetical protein